MTVPPFKKKVHNRNCSFKEKSFQNSITKMAENWITVDNAMHREADFWLFTGLVSRIMHAT